MLARYGGRVPESPPSIDTRFLLANERTLLAWIRTALALLAAGGGVYEFTDISGRRGLAIALGFVGIAAAAAGAARYHATERAIRAGTGIHPGRAPQLLALAVMGMGLALVLSLVAS
jgi:putative membrane protein